MKLTVLDEPIKTLSILLDNGSLIDIEVEYPWMGDVQ